MRHFLFLAMALFAWGRLPVQAQTAKDPYEGVRVSADASTGAQVLTWWGRAGRTYFVQQSFDLLTWNFVPTVQSGADTVAGLNLSTLDMRQYWRVIYTDAPTGGNALTADFDGDGISNIDEVSAVPATNPFLADSDWDGYTDLEESAAGTNPMAATNNPRTYVPDSGPLNPDSSYRNGLRLAYSRKYMQAYHEANQTPPSPPTHTGWGWAVRYSAGSSDYFHPYESSTTQDLVPQVLSDYMITPFPAPDRYLFQTTDFYSLQSNELTTNITSGSSTLSNHFLVRNSYEVQSQPSPAAPVDAQRTIVAFFYDGGTSVSKLKETGTITFSRQNVECSPSMQRHCVVTGRNVVIEPKLGQNPPDIDPRPDYTITQQNYYLTLLDVDITPDTGMAGVVGDMVRSAKPGSRVRHFVTPKKSDELPQDYVEFTALGVDATTFDQLFKWDGGEAGSAANKRKVKRDTTGMTPLKILTKMDGVVADEMQVWVVWCDFIPAPAQGNTTFYPYPLGSSNPIAARFDVSQTAQYAWRFRFTIRPEQIITAPEHPALEGGLPDAPISYVPGRGKPWPLSPTAQDGSAISGDSAKMKWDVTRQMRMTFRNPGLVSKANLQIAGTDDVWIANQDPAKAEDIVAGFPSGAEGNDDPNVGSNGLSLLDEEDDPYNDHSDLGAGLGHPIGQLASMDAPSHAMPNSWGGEGRSFAKECDFRELARVHLWDGTRGSGSFWFRVSDYYSWHHYMNAQWNASTQQWQDAGSSSAPSAP